MYGMDHTVHHASVQASRLHHPNHRRHHTQGYGAQHAAYHAITQLTHASTAHLVITFIVLIGIRQANLVKLGIVDVHFTVELQT